MRASIASALRAAAGLLVEAERLKASPLVLDERLVAQLESDLRRMTKLYKSVPTGPADPSAADRDWTAATKAFQEVEQLFINFHNRVNEIVYEQILGQLPRNEQTGEGGQGKNESWASKQLRETAWAFLASIKTLFPEEYDHERSGKTVRYKPAPWQLAKDREPNIRRYQRAARPFFAALREFIEWSKNVNKPLERSEATERTRIAGFQVIIHNKGRGPSAPDEEDHAEDAMRILFERLGEVRAMIKRAGFGMAFRDLQVHLSFITPPRKGGVSGEYSERKDELWIHRLTWFEEKDPGHTFVHELGHRFYYKDLDAGARKHWDEVISSHLTRITPEVVNLWVNEGLAPLFSRGDLVFGDHAKQRAVEFSKNLSPEEAAQIRFLADWHFGSQDLEEIREALMKHVDEKVAIEHITDYGATNPQEAFAEAFRLFVTKGPGALGPWTRQFFKDISRSAGAPVRSAVAKR